MDCFKFFFKYIFYMNSYYIKNFNRLGTMPPYLLIIIIFFTIKVVKCFWGYFYYIHN